MKTEQEFWDEFSELLDAQTDTDHGRHFEANDPMQSRVYQFMREMNEAGLEKRRNLHPAFDNRFFSCNGRLFSVCKFINGRMELRWG